MLVAEESPASHGSKKGSRDKENIRHKVPIGVSLEIFCLSRVGGACFSFVDPRRKKKTSSRTPSNPPFLPRTPKFRSSMKIMGGNPSHHCHLRRQDLRACISAWLGVSLKDNRDLAVSWLNAWSTVQPRSSILRPVQLTDRLAASNLPVASSHMGYTRR